MQLIYIFRKKEMKSSKGLHDNKKTGLKRTITIIPTETTWTFFTNCHRRNRIASATFLLSQGLARSVNLSSNNFEQQLDTEGINCWDINRKRKFPHFKKERQHHDWRKKLQKRSSNSILQALKKSYAKVQKSYCFSSWISNWENLEKVTWKKLIGKRVGLDIKPSELKLHVHIFSADLWELVEIDFIFFYALANCYI